MGKSISNRSWEFLQKGSHLLGIVRPQTEDQYALGLGFLKDGLDRGEMAVFVSKEDPALVEHAMRRYLGDITAMQKDGQLRISSSNSVYQIGFRKESVLAALSDCYHQALDSGFRGLRVADVTSFGQPHDHLRRLVECDETYDALKLDVTALCMYEMPESYEYALFTKILNCHSAVLDYRLNLLIEPRRFFWPATESVLIELFGTDRGKALTSNFQKITRKHSSEDSLVNIPSEYEILQKTLNELFGELAFQICELIKGRLATMTVYSLKSQ